MAAVRWAASAMGRRTCVAFMQTCVKVHTRHRRGSLAYTSPAASTRSGPHSGAHAGSRNAAYRGRPRRWPERQRATADRPASAAHCWQCTLAPPPRTHTQTQTHTPQRTEISTVWRVHGCFSMRVERGGWEGRPSAHGSAVRGEGRVGGRTVGEIGGMNRPLTHVWLLVQPRGKGRRLAA
jgi:hypothetical protein